MKPRILLFDIETRPLEAFIWRLGEQHVGYEQLIKDWSILAFAAKWLGEKKVVYYDQRKAKDVNNDKRLLEELHPLLDEADIVITQNGKRFDVPKANARFVYYRMSPPSPFKQIDTLQISSSKFGFTSNKLAYTSVYLNKKNKKLDHKKFPGLELWKECLLGNLSAWNEMKKYNIADVLALEEQYLAVRGWDSGVNVAMDTSGCRSCGGFSLVSRGYSYTTTGKYKKYQCKDCGSWSRGSVNLSPKSVRDDIKRKI